jgi:predicted CoA-binding protein
MCDMETRRQCIDDFLARKRLAFVGLSTDEAAFSRSICTVMRKNGYDIVPVNPKASEIDGMPCFAAVGDIVPPVDAALIMTPPARASDVVRECDHAGIGHVWLHRGVGAGSVSQQALDYCVEHEMSVVPGECPLMFVGHPPDAVHRAHATLKKLSGTYPSRTRRQLNAALFLHAAVGWALCGAVMYAGMTWFSMTTALVAHAAAAALIFGLLAHRYFKRRPQTSPFVGATAFMLTTIALDVLIVALLVEKSFEMFTSVAGTWLPFALIFLVSWAMGRRLRQGAGTHHGLTKPD